MKTADYVVRLFLANFVLTIIGVLTIFVTPITLVVSLALYPIIFFGGRIIWNRENKK